MFYSRHLFLVHLVTYKYTPMNPIMELVYLLQYTFHTSQKKAY